MSAPAVTAPFLASVVVLASAGVAKAWRPDETAAALRVAGLASHRSLVRAGAVIEIVLAVLAVAAPGRLTGLLVALSYAGFTAFVATALVRKWPLSSCGCFGRPDARPGIPHLVMDAGAVVAGAWWAATAPGRIGPLFVQSPWHGLPLALVIVVIAGLAYAIWTNPLERARP